MKTQGVSLPHAVQLLKNGAPLDAAHVGVARSHKRHLPSLVAGEGQAPIGGEESEADAASTQTELRAVLDYYTATLKQSPEALAYLASRGLDHSELIDHFQLGYANRTLTYRLAPGHTQAGKAERGRLQAAGILRASGHEHFNGCIVVSVIGLEDGANLE